MKLSYLSILLILTLHCFTNPPRYQYCVSYCTREDTVFDAVHHPLMSDGAITRECSNRIYELRNGDCPAEFNMGLNTILSPTTCERLKNYNGQTLQGDGTKAYKDGAGIEWTYKNFTRTGESDNPKTYISSSKKLREVCLEIPLLKYKIVLYSLDNHQLKNGYYERLMMDGSKFVIELVRVSSADEPTNPVESRTTYDFKYLFEENRNKLLVTNPNPFDNQIKVMLAKEVLDSNTNLKLVLRDNIGKKITEQNVDGPITSINTVLVNPGKYMLFLMKKDEILEYKQVLK
jgi:hypothetical protein